MIGIYLIENLVTGCKYIGQSKKISKRLSYHIGMLKNKKHFNRLLQIDWNFFGGDSFKFDSLEECPEELLTEREQFWIDYFPETYNLIPAGAPPNYWIGKRRSEETKRKISGSVKGFTHTKETKEKISKALLGKKYPYKKGVQRGEDWNKNISHGIQEKWKDPCYRKKILESQRRFTPEQVKEIRDSNLSCAKLAAKFEVNKTTVWAVRRNKTYSEEFKVSQLVEVLWNSGLLENRDFTLVGEEAHGLKMYRGDLEDLLKEHPELNFKLLRIEVPDFEDPQMDYVAVEIFFRKKK